MPLPGEKWEYRGGEERRAWDRSKVREGDEARTTEKKSKTEKDGGGAERGGG